MASPFLGEIRPVSFNFAPSGWAECNGHTLPIIQNPDLFNLIGTTYGGDGVTTFNLPDLRGRTPIHHGAGPGLTGREIGENGGAETVTLTAGQMPTHNHELRANLAKGTAKVPTGNVNATNQGSYGPYPGSPVTMNGNAIGPNGGGEAHENMEPYLAVNYIIALTGTYPTQG